MEKLKIKAIGVLREREDAANVNGVNRITTVTVAVGGGIIAKGNDSKVDGGGGDGGGGGGGAGAAAGGGVAAAAAAANEAAGGRATASAFVRQLPKMSALDLAGILNCRRRLEWTKEWLKKNQTEFLSKENLRKELHFRSNEIYHFNCFFDITERQFRYLVSKLSPVISSYEPHRKKKSFSAEERIAITLKYLATGEVHSCRNYCFRASKPVILKMIANICLNMYDLLKDQFVSLPKTDEQWQNVANELQRKHCLPNCAGHLAMQQTKFHTTSRAEEQLDFVNKRPLILTSIVDSNNNFMYIDLEKTKARACDEIYEQSTVRQLIEGGAIKLPVSYEPQDGVTQTYYFACSDVLPLKSYLLASLPNVPNDTRLQFNYNYAMDMTSRHTENAQRLLANIFPILSQPLRIDEENGRKIVLGCVALYNFLRKTDRAFYKHTEKITLKNDLVDDDCILIGSDEEYGDHEEFMPKVVLTSCFRNLNAQKGFTLDGAAKRDYIMKRLGESNAIN